MKSSSSTDPRDRAAGTTPDGTSIASFEELLEQLFHVLHRSTDPHVGIQTALHMIAVFFSAERAMVTVPGCPAPATEGSFDIAPDVTEEIELGPERGIGTAALFGSQRAGSWTDRHSRQLGIAARAVSEALCRQRAESELREQQIWLVMAMESASVGVWDWDLENDSVRFLSRSEEHADGLRIQHTRASEESEWYHPDDHQAASIELEKAISGETDGFSRVVRQRVRSDPDGRWHHVYSRGRVIERDAAGRAVRIMGTYEDVTEAYERNLAEKAREAAMARATRMASLGVLASSLAHDLNQPLTALTSFLEGTIRLLSRGQAAEADVVDALERSVSFAHRASDIVRSFRRLLQHEAPVRDAVELSSLLQRVRDRMQQEAAANGVEVEVQEAPEPVVFQGDGLQIEQVVVNLVRNAIEALGGSDRRRRIVTLNARKADGLVEVRVADNGPGIPCGILDRLFEPLATSKEAGRGLGLAICHSIAEIHGGRLQVERSGPEGATFVLALPSDEGGHR
jgi:two-component system, LuxR family, sensor kinase FixL